MTHLNFWLIFGSSLLLVTGGTPLMRWVGLKLGVVDRPSERKRHVRPVPLLGGVAIWASVVGALLFQGHRFEIVQAGAILVGATWISLWGALDDYSGLRVSVKLVVQIVAAVLLVVSGIEVRLALPYGCNLALTLLWLLGITNAFNLLDNMDGLCATVGAVASAFFLLLAVMNGQYLVGALAAALLGACLGFLLWNWNPARIFMGDSGSLFIGFCVGTLGIKLRFPENVPSVTWWVPVLVVGVAVFDTSLVFFSRWRRGLNPLTSPGNDHLSHRLVDRGMTERGAVGVIAGVGALLGGLGVLVSVSGHIVAYTVGCLSLCAGAFAFFALERQPGATGED